MKTKHYLIILSCLIITISQGKAQDKQAEQIINNYLEAVGGKKLWEKTQTRYDSVLSSTCVNVHLEKSSQGFTETFTVTYKKKPKMHKSISYKQNGIQTFFCDGQEIYMKTKYGDVMKIEDEKALELVEFSEVDDFIDFQKLAFQGEEYLDGSLCLVVDVYHSEDTSSFVRGYFSKETFFLIKRQSYLNQQPIKLYGRFGNYQKAENGLVIPFLEESYNQKDDLLFKTQRIKVVFDLPLKDKIFKP
jgi:hypothetical protein